MAPSIISHTTLPADAPEAHHTPEKAHMETLFTLKHRTIVITGAGRGLGITLAIAVLEAGGNVICLDILPDPSKTEWDIITKIQKASKLHASYHQCDITNEDAVTEILLQAGNEAAKRGTPIRGLVSCAGIQQVHDAIDYPLDGFRRILEVNVTGSFLVAKHTARVMREQHISGSIVFIASMSGQIANRVSYSQTRVPSSRYQRV